MEKLKKMTDEELISALRKNNLQHGPIVDSTRTLYEKKLYEYERTKTKYAGSSGSGFENTQQYSRRDYDDADNDKYETYEEQTYTKSYGYPQAQGVSDELRHRGTDNTYQNISHVRHQASYSQGIEPRKPIRPKPKVEAVPDQPAKRFLPLWLQLLLLLLFAGYLAYLYFRETNQNPFKYIEENLFQSEESAATD